ncbi:hypothetical protein [Treponema sp.]|uniref:hypothetical protein n=1 Tax=Treponema sp. TaxID=166 RepID=UPI0025D404CB|nr:hypothetical protein [Treponema sp.]MCR5218646.1 hypothetical protein [Treponema sp.]
MAVHQKNPSFADLARAKVNNEIQESMAAYIPEAIPEKGPFIQNDIKSVTSPADSTQQGAGESAAENSDSKAAVASKKRKDVLIGIHVTDDERNELRKMFCSNGFSLATAYRAAMTYLRQDIELGKAYITSNGEVIRKG